MTSKARAEKQVNAGQEMETGDALARLAATGGNRCHLWATRFLQVLPHPLIDAARFALTRPSAAVIAWLAVVLDGELAVPCTRNPL